MSERPWPFDFYPDKDSHWRACLEVFDDLIELAGMYLYHLDRNCLERPSEIQKLIDRGLMDE